jgi:hypothetical protein
MDGQYKPMHVLREGNHLADYVYAHLGYGFDTAMQE